MTMTSTVSAEDPCPEVPAHFVDPLRILKLAREIKGHVAAAKDEPDEIPESAAAAVTIDAQEDEPSPTPKPKVRSMVATRGDVDKLGEILAQAAWRAGSRPRSARRSLGMERRETGEFTSGGSAATRRSSISFMR